MSAGVNYVGGRGRIAPRQSKNLERLPKAHFARQRFVDYTQTAQARADLPVKEPFMLFSLQHARRDVSGRDSLGLFTPDEHFNHIYGPHVIDRPSKPGKQSKLLDMMDGIVRQDESFDASRSRVSTTNIKDLLGLDIQSRKRKCETETNWRRQKSSLGAFTHGFDYPEDIKPRAFVCSPTIASDPTIGSDSEEMLSFEEPRADNLQPPTGASSQNTSLDEPQPTRIQDTAGPPNPQSQQPPASPNIPPNLWVKSYLLAAKTMGLPSTDLPLEASSPPRPMPTGTSVDHCLALRGYTPSTLPDDEIVCAFNLVTPTFHGHLAEAEGATAQDMDPNFSDLFDSHELDHNSLVISSDSLHGLHGFPGAGDLQNKGRPAETEERRAPWLERGSYLDNAPRPDTPAAYPTDTNWPVIQPVPTHSQRPRQWIPSKERRAAGLSGMLAAGNLFGMAPQIEDAGAGRLVVEETATEFESSQESGVVSQPYAASTNSFDIFEFD